MDKEQLFIHHSIYPNAADIFNMKLLPLDSIQDDCIYIIDTNALLIPYATSSSGFDEIKKVYTKLIERKQLIIPGQVAREFAKNRPEKIKTLFQQLSRIRDKIQKPATGQYPLLEKLNEYAEAVKLEKEVEATQKKYSMKIGELLDKIKSWRWNDPISEVYNELFSPEIVHDLEIDEEKIFIELERRNKFSIPPGFKDKSKEDGGIGDLLIWLSIIDVAQKKGKHIVLVSGDEKNDWFHRSEKQPLYPRFELLAEFKSRTDNKSFHIIRLSKLLTDLGVDKKVIKEVENSEQDLNIEVALENLGRDHYDERALNWLKKMVNGPIIFYGTLPSMIIEENSKREGVDVITIRKDLQSTYVTLVDHILRIEGIRNELSNDLKLDNYMIIVVADSKTIIHKFVTKFTSMLASLRLKSNFIRFIMGFVGDDNEFEVYTRS